MAEIRGRDGRDGGTEGEEEDGRRKEVPEWDSERGGRGQVEVGQRGSDVQTGACCVTTAPTRDYSPTADRYDDRSGAVCLLSAGRPPFIWAPPAPGGPPAGLQDNRIVFLHGKAPRCLQ